jgi:uncharacterized protein YwqG
MAEPLSLPAPLEPWRAQLEAAAAPCLRFTLEDAEDPATPGCRYGGHPLVPPGTAWPTGPKGLLHFVGQLDFAELASVHGGALADLPRDGVLCLFYDMQEQPWGFEEGDRASWKLLWTPRREDAVPLPPPQALEDAGLAFDLPVRMVSRLALSLPDPSDVRGRQPPGRWTHKELELYETLRLELSGGENGHQVGGFPWWVQQEARTEAQELTRPLFRTEARGPGALKPQRHESAAEWTALWQIGSDDLTGFMWGDMGNLYLLVHDTDLRAQRFDRAWLGLQCG